MTRRTRNHVQRGEIGLLGIFAVTAIIAGTALAAGIYSAVINSGQNRKTLDILSNPDATQQQLGTISDQDLQNLSNDLNNNAKLLTNFVALGTTPIPGGGTSADVAARTMADLVVSGPDDLPGTLPNLVKYFSNPDSSWNRNNGANRPAGGTAPTGGIPPSDVPGGTGDVRLSLVWNDTVDMDLHVIDPCGNEISFDSTTADCQGQTGQLDVDNRSGGPQSVENIFWPMGGAPSGTYSYWVECFSGCSAQPATFTLSLSIGGQRTPITGTLTADGEESQRWTFTR